MICGLDFGTSNTTLGVVHQGRAQLVELERGKSSIRSAIFCDVEAKEWVFGQEGVDRYLESCPGRLMMALKSVLGTSLMDEKTLIFDEWVSYHEVLARFVKHVKKLAETVVNMELTHVVMGRPVYFHDHDREKDKLAENTLHSIAKSVGFKEISFQYEPIAAAMSYEAQITREQLALIVDMGGGTSDFTVIRLSPGKKAVNRMDDVLSNSGIHIAGTDFDQRLSLKTMMPLLGLGTLMRGSSSDLPIPAMLYHDLTTWHTLNNNYTPTHLAYVRSIQAKAYDKVCFERLLNVLKKRSAHYIMQEIENAKQRLSDVFKTDLDLHFIASELTSDVERDVLNDVIQEDVQKIIETIRATVQAAHVNFQDISAIFYTGGSTKIPMIRSQINALFPNAEIVQGDAFGSVGLGLTLEAASKY